MRKNNKNLKNQIQVIKIRNTVDCWYNILDLCQMFKL